VKRLEYNHNELQRRREFPDWEKMYVEQAVETMPWFHPELDADLESALDRFSIDSGSFLDLGTGPGTQAIALAERGFRVTGTDISKTAVRKAAALTAERGLDLVFADVSSRPGSIKSTTSSTRLLPCARPDKKALRHDSCRASEPGGYLFETFRRGIDGRRAVQVHPGDKGIFPGGSSRSMGVGLPRTLGFPKALFCVLRKK
jgi:SAM-dependent methyltransferase